MQIYIITIHMYFFKRERESERNNALIKCNEKQESKTHDDKNEKQ